MRSSQRELENVQVDTVVNFYWDLVFLVGFLCFTYAFLILVLPRWAIRVGAAGDRVND